MQGDSMQANRIAVDENEWEVFVDRAAGKVDMEVLGVARLIVEGSVTRDAPQDSAV